VRAREILLNLHDSPAMHCGGAVRDSPANLCPAITEIVRKLRESAGSKLREALGVRPACRRLGRAHPFESGSKLHALQTLTRRSVAALPRCVGRVSAVPLVVLFVAAVPPWNASLPLRLGRFHVVQREQTMAEELKCGECGAPIPPEAQQGFCQSACWIWASKRQGNALLP